MRVSIPRVLGLVAALSGTVEAQPVMYQGRLTSGGSSVVDGSYSLTFRVFDAPVGGILLDEPVGPLDAETDDGVFEVEIPLNGIAFNAPERWLEITVNGAVLSPRQRVGASPRSLATRGIVVDDRGFVGINEKEPSEWLDVGGPIAATQYQLAGAGGQATFALRYSEDFSAGPGFFMSTGNLVLPIFLGRDDTFGRVAVLSQFDVGRENAQVPFNIYGPTNAFNDFRVWDGFIAERVSVTGDGGGPNDTVFDVDGLGRVRVLEIRGGADLAEPFDIEADTAVEVTPGMVVSISPTTDGVLVPATSEYDAAVAGVVSGANGVQPGLTLRADDVDLADGDYPVAMTGRVWVLADATYGPIRRGDRLTTSSTPGHAMAVRDNARAPGAVIGKAMSELEEGRGLVWMIVQPQ